MDKIRTCAKKLLVNTPAFDVAKRIYGWVKVKRDAYEFKQKCPNGLYVHYSSKELVAQRENGFISQYGQDYFLWHEILHQKTEGVFVDIGANQPIANSNSLYLERAGWVGVAIDPLKRFQGAWKQQRKTELVCAAVSDEEQDEEFIEIKQKQGWEHALSGFKRFIRPEDLAIYEYEEYRVNAKPLDQFVRDPAKVDLILIDVEGAEMKVLSGIDFNAFSPEYILIENDNVAGGCDSIRHFLSSVGYRCIVRISATDDLYIRQRNTS